MHLVCHDCGHAVPTVQRTTEEHRPMLVAAVRVPHAQPMTSFAAAGLAGRRSTPPAQDRKSGLLPRGSLAYSSGCPRFSESEAVVRAEVVEVLPEYVVLTGASFSCTVMPHTDQSPSCAALLAARYPRLCTTSADTARSETMEVAVDSPIKLTATFPVNRPGRFPQWEGSKVTGVIVYNLPASRICLAPSSVPIAPSSGCAPTGSTVRRTLAPHQSRWCVIDPNYGDHAS
jgi:hypothetical protein